MSTLTITNNFTNSTTADAEQVDTNFSDVKTFVDTHAVHKGETALEAKTGSPSNKFQVGTITISPTSSDAGKSGVVTFPVAFTTAPRVWAQNAVGSGGAKKWLTTVDDPASTTQVTIWVFSSDLNPPSGTINIPIYWFAIGT